MKDYKWAPAMRVIREAVAANISMKNKSLETDLSISMLATDEFHPFDYDSERLLQRALAEIPLKRNWRNPTPWRFGQSNVINYLACFIEDTNEIIESYYTEPMNFAPGYTKPVTITAKLEPYDLAIKIFWPVHRAAHGLTK